MSGAAKGQPHRRATIEDLYAIPEEIRRHELVDGEIIEKGAATGEHGATQASLVVALGSRFGRRPGGRWPGGWWFATEVEKVPHYWILDPTEETLAVHRWSADGYVEVLAAQRGERVRAEPFDAVELEVGAFFGDDEVDDEGRDPRPG
jgi:Uma2 family endonuclease